MNGPDTLYLVISEFGLANLYYDEGDAVAQAKYLHTLEDDPAQDFCAVWVVQQSVGDNDASFPLGMFPDRKGEGAPGEWLSAFDAEGKQKSDFPWPEFVWKGSSAF